MSESQKSEPFETPERSTIRRTTREHIQAMERSAVDAVWIQAGMHHLILHTIGWRSGEERKAALPYWRDSHGHPIVVASYAGAKEHPSWFKNLSQSGKQDEVLTRLQKEAFWAGVEILEGEEYKETWEALTEDRPFYRDYQALTERQIPLVRLRRSRAAEA